jgi:hypothetical protein
LPISLPILARINSDQEIKEAPGGLGALRLGSDKPFAFYALTSKPRIFNILRSKSKPKPNRINTLHKKQGEG